MKITMSSREIEQFSREVVKCFIVDLRRHVEKTAPELAGGLDGGLEAIRSLPVTSYVGKAMMATRDAVKEAIDKEFDEKMAKYGEMVQDYLATAAAPPDRGDQH